MSVVGIDVGNQNAVIAAARQGGIEVLTNEYTYRLTPYVALIASCSRFSVKITSWCILFSSVEMIDLFARNICGSGCAEVSICVCISYSSHASAPIWIYISSVGRNAKLSDGQAPSGSGRS